MTADIDTVYSFRQSGLRENQEDSRYPDADCPGRENAVFVVCDGVGGCEKGEVASGAVCARIGEVLSSHKKTDAFDDRALINVLNQAYEALDKASDASNKGMATTLAFLAFHSAGVMAAHIGDSRIYQIRPGEGIIYRSEDHSLVNALLRSGNISPEDVKGHPRSNVITRCMSADDGTRDRDEATVVNLRDVVTGDYFLLLTDGVTGKVDDEELLDLYFSDKTDEEKITYLARRCEDSSDNNTAIQIHVGMITVNPEEEHDHTDTDFESDGVTSTLRLPDKDDSVHDLSTLTEKRQSKLKTFFNRFFK